MKARRQNPNSMKALLRLGELYVQEGEPLKAVHIYSDILNKTPYQYDVYLCRARIFEKIGEYSKSFDDLNKIPKTMIVLKAEVLKAKGRVLARMNKVTEAIAVCEEVASMEPTTDNLARVGLLFIRMKDYRNALGWYEQATLMNETHPKYIYNLGCCYEALRQNEKAIDCYEKSLKLDPNAKETVIALSRMKSLGTSRGLNISEKNISSAKSTSKVN
jgi:tetratricopeptide (TPR) repeat protein